MKLLGRLASLQLLGKFDMEILLFLSNNSVRRIVFLGIHHVLYTNYCGLFTPYVNNNYMFNCMILRNFLTNKKEQKYHIQMFGPNIESSVWLVEEDE